MEPYGQIGASKGKVQNQKRSQNRAKIQTSKSGNQANIGDQEGEQTEDFCIIKLKKKIKMNYLKNQELLMN